MLMLALVRTPDQHDQAGISDPPAQAIPQSDLPVAGLQECATTPSHLLAIFVCNFFSGLECAGYSFAYVAHFVFFREMPESRKLP